jgi:hypothetical protein
MRVFQSADSGDEFARLLVRSAKLRRSLRDDELAHQIESLTEGLFTAEQARELFVCFEDAKVKLARKKVSALKEEYGRWLLVKAKPETDREGETARTRCRELEQELDVWESRTKPIDERVAELRSRFADHYRQVEEAYAALDGGSNRRKAEVVRGMFTRIVFHFRREQKAKYSRTVWESDKTEFEINPMDGSCRRNCRRCRGTATTGTRRPPGFRSRSRRS